MVICGAYVHDNLKEEDRFSSLVIYVKEDFIK